MTMVERAPPEFIFSAQPNETREPWFFDPREIRRTMRLRWLLVLLPILAFTGAALAWTALFPPQYAASTQILMDPRGLQVVKDEVNPQGQMNEGSLLLVDSQIRIVTSDAVLGQVVERFQLTQDPEFNGGPTFLDTARATIAEATGRPAPAEVDPKLTALRTLRDRVGAKRLERSFVVELGVTTNDPDKSARLAQAIAETYLALDSATRSEATRKAGAALSSRLAELRDAVRNAENQAQQFRAAHNLVGTRAQLVSEQQLGQLSDQLGAARARAAELRARLEQIEALTNGAVNFDAVTEVVQSATITQLRTQLAQAERARAEAVASLGPRHPGLVAADVQVRSLRGQIEAEIKRIAAAERNNYRAAAGNETALAASLDQRKSEALSVGEDSVRLRELERQVEASRAVYEAFLIRARELQEQQQLDTSTSRIISPASPPARRLGPSTPVLLAAALAAGLGVGLLGGLLAEQVGGRIRSRRRLEQGTGLAVMGALPRPAWRRDPFAASRRPNDRFEVALARLRGRLQRDPAPAKPLTAVVTSADDGRGKSMLALALAGAATREGQRVLLVDADLRGRVSRDLGLKAPRNLADLLEGRATLTEVLAQHTSGLKFLALGDAAGRADAGQLAAKILDEAEPFDLVLVNAGLIGGDALTERLVNDPRFATVLLTASASRSSLHRINRALGALGDRGRVSLVLTDADPSD